MSESLIVGVGCEGKISDNEEEKVMAVVEEESVDY